MCHSMTPSIKVGDLITLPDAERQWRVVYVDDARGFIRLECQDQALVRSRVVSLDEVRPLLSDTTLPNRTAQEIVDEFSGSSWRP